MNQNDLFGGDQTLFELSYNADFFIGLVGSVAGYCTGLAAPFFIYKLPNPSFTVKQWMLGGRFGFIGFVYPNPYTGMRFGDDDDPRRPSTASGRVAKELIFIAEEAEAIGFLCDVRLWDFVQDYANSSLELVNYTIEVLTQEQRISDAQKLRETVDPQFIKIQNFVNGDPSRQRDWRYELTQPILSGTVTE